MTRREESDLKQVLDGHFKANRIAFKNPIHSEIRKAQLFFCGVFWAVAIVLGVLPTAGQYQLSFDVGFVSLVTCFLAGAACIVFYSRPRKTIVSEREPVSDELLLLIAESPAVARKVKKQIAIEMKRQGYISYEQVLLFEDQHHLADPTAIRLQDTGAARLLSDLGKGQLG